MHSLCAGYIIYHNTGENYYDVYVYTKFLSLSGTILLSNVSISIVYLFLYFKFLGFWGGLVWFVCVCVRMCVCFGDFGGFVHLFVSFFPAVGINLLYKSDFFLLVHHSWRTEESLGELLLSKRDAPKEAHLLKLLFCSFSVIFSSHSGTASWASSPQAALDTFIQMIKSVKSFNEKAFENNPV